VIALKVAQEMPDRVAGFVAVSAVIPADGGSFVFAMPFPKRLILGLVLRLAGTRPPASAIRRGLCSDLTSDQADQVVSRFVPESRAVYLERSDAPSPEVPTLYVQLTEDREIPVALQARMARNLGAGQVVTIDSGHLPMLSRPDELARVLNDFTATLG
jgi:pimeloyl-ACP methyl ester carboxylesterase